MYWRAWKAQQWSGSLSGPCAKTARETTTSLRNLPARCYRVGSLPNFRLAKLQLHHDTSPNHEPRPPPSHDNIRKTRRTVPRFEARVTDIDSKHSPNFPILFLSNYIFQTPRASPISSTMAGGKGKSSGGKSSGGKTSAAEGPKKQQSHSSRAGLQVSIASPLFASAPPGDYSSPSTPVTTPYLPRWSCLHAVASGAHAKPGVFNYIASLCTGAQSARLERVSMTWRITVPIVLGYDRRVFDGFLPAFAPVPLAEILLCVTHTIIFATCWSDPLLTCPSR